jgi:agmatinase
LNFLGPENQEGNYENAKAVVLCAPYEATCTYGSGTSKGPEAIIEASAAAELYDEELGIDLAKAGIATLPPLPVDNMDPEEMVEEVSRKALSVLGDGKVPVGLGGEHTVTLGFQKAMLEHFPSLTVLQIDAHPDMRDEYEGRKVCHATVGRRIMERCALVQVGLRAFSKEEGRLLDEQASLGKARVQPFSAYFIHTHPDWIQKVIPCLSEHVYITFDVDALDPSLIPHTGTPEPGGLSWRQTCDLLRAVAYSKKLVGFDVVELAPDATSRSSDFTAARLVMRLIGHCVGPTPSVPKLPFS